MRSLINEGRLTSFSFSPDGNQLVSTDGQQLATIWDTNTGEKLLTLNHANLLKLTFNDMEMSGGVCSAAFSPDGRYVVTGSSPTIAALWDVRAGNLIRTYQLDYSNYLIPPQTYFAAVGFSPDGKQLLTSLSISETHLWDVVTGEHIKLVVRRGGNHSVGFFQKNQNLVYLIGESTFYVADFDTGEKLYRLSGIASSLSYDEKFVYSYSNEGFQVFDSMTGELISLNRDFPFPDEGIPKMATSRNGKFVVVGKLRDSTRPARVYGLSSTVDTPLRSHDSTALETEPETEVTLIRFSPDSRKVAMRYSTVSDEYGGPVYIYDISDLSTFVPKARQYDN